MGAPQGAAADEGEGREREVDEVEGGVGQGEEEGGGVVAGAPPLERHGQHFGAWAEGHVEQTRDGKRDVEAERRGVDAVAGEGVEGGVEGWGGGVGEVVTIEQAGGGVVLGL